MFVFVQPTLEYRRLCDRQQSCVRSDPADRDSPGRIVTTGGVAFSRVSHVFTLVLLGDVFSGVVLSMKPFLDIRATE